MKLLRYGPKNQEKPGVLDAEGHIRDLSPFISDISAETISDESLQRIKNLDFAKLLEIPASVRIGPCIGQVNNFLCVGLNYKDHAEETGKALPVEPVLFNKLTSAISGPYDDIMIPRASQKTDWEAELGVVIGKAGKYIDEKDAMDYIAGFCVVNDVSERTFQMERAGQWVKGKSCDTFAPIGPWLVTKDEIPNVQNLEIWCDVDNERKQNSNTKEMIFNVAYLISYLSQFFTLQPGCIIATGTPAGVGLGQKPAPIFLKPGQVVRLGLQGLGIQEHKVIKES
jgi:2-keto-4-pentenoate hydratase/2-oxohepta-3-ene-1,7-dioic acid hydratase in catechol pathway